MTYDRRKFLKQSGLLATAFTLGNSALKAFGEEANTNKALKQFGLQLWTIKDALGKDVPGTLKQVSSFGYKQIEGFEGGKGVFWGMKNTEFKKLMDDLGMSFISSHCNINKDFEQKAAQAAEIGMKYLICPYLGPQKTLDDYKKAAVKFNECGEICKKNGIRFAYHNHGYSFTQLENVYPQDIFMQNTDASIVDYEMDIYWVVAVGQDPVAWMQKYPNRFRLCHVKDRKKDAGPKDMDASCELGTGSINFPSLLKPGKKQGLQYYIVEQEKFENSTSMKSAEIDADYMKKLSV